MRRVVVTGMGIVCPLGMGVAPVWQRLVTGHSGITAITAFNSDGLSCRVAGQVPPGLWSELPDAEGGRGSRVGQLARLAARQAAQDAGWQPRDEEEQEAAGVSIGSGCGGLEAIHEGVQRLQAGALEEVGRLLPAAMLHQLAVDVAHDLGLRGPRRAVSTACSSGAHAIGDAARLIACGDAEVMLAGGAEAAISELGIAGFAAARALSSAFNDTPGRASRPWDRDRDGFVMGEGAGMLVLEEREHARRRGARIYAELSGYGMSADAHHVTAPAEGHEGGLRAMRNALRSGGVAPSEVQYVNAHGTSTPLGDDLELEAVERLFGDAARGLAMSSTKSATGHMLGAAGAAEAIFSVLTIHEGVVPPTLNLDRPSRPSVIDRVARSAQGRRVRVALSNSFGFGGTNASILFRAA
ncbi:beta-ketoacyl-ACP synthase II [Paracraurococcus lichenis]|uniref:3-oxoacyl-[acyl-carrier-protein] synthase 2 n=1 Tax=Paracraurococcus lichenis TaxID=3064888 RepID=A0ABT9EDP1_9PROT|nr:beta-ketoacyl-ACP synthase II [Paracraurococcus sp. LOR1-02]MDO9714328.1 beta-ketoacyl-ACP synthase II [Paracraurococcus sp. LOR1-02]